MKPKDYYTEFPILAENVYVFCLLSFGSEEQYEIYIKDPIKKKEFKDVKVMCENYHNFESEVNRNKKPVLCKPSTMVCMDLGTTYSYVSEVDKFGKAMNFLNIENERTMPSVVCSFEDNVILGNEDKGNTFLSADKVKLFENSAIVGASLFPGYNDKTRKLEKISSILLKLENVLDQNTRGKIIDIMFFCADYFWMKKRNATKIASDIIVLNARRIINEPMVAVNSHCIEEKSLNECFLVYDLGGGTFDISIIDRSFSIVDVIVTGQYIDIVDNELDNVGKTERVNLKRKRNLRNNIKTRIELMLQQITFPLLEKGSSVDKAVDSLLILGRAKPFNPCHKLLGVLFIDDAMWGNFMLVNTSTQQETLTGSLRIKANQRILHAKSMFHQEFDTPTESRLAHSFEVDWFKLSWQFYSSGDVAAPYLKPIAEEIVQEVSERIGFCTCDYFIRRFRQFFGIAPGSYRESKTRHSGVKNLAPLSWIKKVSHSISKKNTFMSIADRRGTFSLLVWIKLRISLFKKIIILGFGNILGIRDILYYVVLPKGLKIFIFKEAKAE